MRTGTERWITRLWGVALLAGALVSGSTTAAVASDTTSFIGGMVAGAVVANAFDRDGRPLPRYYAPSGRYNPHWRCGEGCRDRHRWDPWGPGERVRYVPSTVNGYDPQAAVPMAVKLQRIEDMRHAWLRAHPDNGTRAWRREFERFLEYQEALVYEHEWRLAYGTEPPFRGDNYHGYGKWDGYFHDGFDYDAVYGGPWQRQRWWNEGDR